MDFIFVGKLMVFLLSGFCCVTLPGFVIPWCTDKLIYDFQRPTKVQQVRNDLLICCELLSILVAAIMFLLMGQYIFVGWKI